MPHSGKLSINKGTGPPSHEMSDVENSRFQVNKVGVLDPDDAEGLDGLSPNQMTYVYDTRYQKSLGQLTREALPKLDNYRDPASIQHGFQRPTIEELHNATYVEKVSPF